ncbi:MAG: hypothetical protein E7545_05605 [Ruminococcaceae bacterium]|nr:hypothetical protein [Oscillospiraceae bacterium]
MNIKIADRTLSIKDRFSFKEKIEIARQLEKLGVSAIEIHEMENVKTDALLVKTMAYFVKNGVISVAAVPTKQGIDDVVSALATANKGRIRIELPVSVVGMEYSCHKKPDKMLVMINDLVSYAKARINDVEFVAVDATRAEFDFLKEAIATARNAGATLVTVCDTAAEMMPDEFGAFVKELAVDGVACENKNGLAVANAVMAVKNGANTVKTAVSNEISLETFAGVIKNCGNSFGFESTVKYTELNRIINQINWIMGNTKSAKAAVKAGDFEEELSLDQNDDKQTVLDTIMRLGYDLSDDDATKVYEEFLRVAANRKVTSKELDVIVATVALQVEPTYKLVNFVVNSGNIFTASAQITMDVKGEQKQGISTGDGPIDAAFHAIEQIIGCHYELDDFQIQSVTEGKGAIGQAVVKLRVNGKLYSGNGISTDIIAAAIKAYINAVNKIVYEEA